MNKKALFNNNWKFAYGDIKNAQNTNFNDRTWKNIDLPHDWVISRPFSRGETEGWTSQNMQGFFAWEGICWYRKAFNLDHIDGKTIYICFGCAHRNSTIYVNGKEAGGRANGYISFDIDITEFVLKGKNIIAVRLDNGSQQPDRWYSGSGLFRNVYLKSVPKVHIKTFGINLKAYLFDNKKKADVGFCVTVVNKGADKERSSSCVLRVNLIDSNGESASENSFPFTFAGKKEVTVERKMVIKNPLLWSAEEPNLYRACFQLEIGGEAAETEEVRFGVRSFGIAYNKGMTVNGKKIKLKGVCLHHDCGITGAAHYDEVWRRRLGILKSIGCNAIRTSHNPYAQEFLDLCDEMGFYVIDECFDKWKSGHYASLFDTEAEKDLTDFILRDRNHPSVFMWSVGNEVENQGKDSMLALQKQLVSILRKLDSRPVTCALAPHANPRTLVGAPVNELVKLTKKIVKDVDIIGVNYHEPLYKAYTDGIEKPIIGTECYEYYSSVGTNFEDVCDKNPWQFVLENDNVIGQFIWAGFDYLGESSWPAKGWAGSILDICGFYKPNAFFRKSIWTDEPFVYLAFYDQSKKPDYTRGRWSFPQLTSHLNHKNLFSGNAKAVIFTNCEEGELWINGKKMGRRKRKDFNNGIIEWNFEYHYGNIEIKGINNNKEVCSYILKTADNAKKIKLIPDKKNLKPGEIAHIEVNITDKNDHLCQTEDFLIDFSLTGTGVAQILGACSPDLNHNLGFTLPKTVTSEGKALVMIKAGDSGGNIELCAYSEKLEKAQIKFKVK